MGFYGQNTSSHGEKYQHHRRGILDDIPYRKLIRGVILIEPKDLDTVSTFLDKGFTYKGLVAEDRRVLGLSQ